MEKVLIAGISGGQGRLLARRLRRHFEVCGADRSNWEGGEPRGIRVYTLDLRKRKFEDVIRSERPRAVVHLGFLRDLRADPRLRHDVNVRGTRLLLDRCARHGVRNVVIVSSSAIYGALPDNPFFLDEQAPLSASRSWPEVRDLVEVDTLATSTGWSHPQLRTCLLRPVHVLGSDSHSLMARYLRMRWVPAVMGFDPMLQFLHEEDLSESIARVLEQDVQGVFNVTGAGEVPLSVAIRACGGRRIPLPEPAVRPLLAQLFWLGVSPFPTGAIDHLKYPLTVSGKRFREATGFEPLFGLEETFQSVRRLD